MYDAFAEGYRIYKYFGLKTGTMKPMRSNFPYKTTKDTGWIAALGLGIADQLTKYGVSAMDSPVNFGEITIARVLNPVGVFGFEAPNMVLIMVGASICLALASLLATTVRKPATRLGVWLLLGGAFSNLIDRFMQGGVVDVISIGSSSVFNFADIMILLGAISLLRSTWWRK